MKISKKKIAPVVAGLAVLVSASVPMSASAINYDPWPTASYLPLTGSFYADKTKVKVSGLTWSATQISNFNSQTNSFTTRGLEFEFRPIDVNTNYIWYGINYSASNSNFPDVYWEFQPGDGNDVAIRFCDVSQLRSDRTYWATMVLGERPSFTNTSQQYNFDIEYCHKNLLSSLVNDYIPDNFTRYNGTTPQFGNPYTW